MEAPALQIVAMPVSAELCARAKEYIEKNLLDEAEELLDQALEQNIGDAAALALMGEVFVHRKDLRQAVGHYVLAIQADPSSADYKQRFMDLAWDIPVARHSPAVSAVIVECLKTPGLSFDDARVLWVTNLYLQPGFHALFAKTTRTRFFQRKKNPFESVKDFSPLLTPYFLLGLRKIVAPDRTFELFLTRLRHFLLDQVVVSLPKPDPGYADLALALAHYCYNTDYVFFVEKEEQKRAEVLRASVESGKTQTAGALAVLGCYMPLSALKNAVEVEEILLSIPGMESLARYQITEYFSLRTAKDAIPAATLVENDVSSKVREQYEDFPYPRWRELPKARLIHNPCEMDVLDRQGVQALVAGCGTGNEVAHLAALYPKAEFLAVDLSRTSLAYAAGKATEYGLGNIDFQQADILRLGALNRTFDYITSCGVLHHMQDPLKGWSVLTDLLNPGGLMRIGLYSHAARSSINRARKAIKAGGYSSTAEDMRRFRKESPELLDAKTFHDIGRMRDFFHLSTVRDLLFHVQEHQFDIPEIETALQTLGLSFVAMRAPPMAAARYDEMFPSDPKRKNLGHWHTLENKYPDTFIGMYVFWCRKDV
jgi:SAM-dependent methyltransferase